MGSCQLIHQVTYSPLFGSPVPSEMVSPILVTTSQLFCYRLVTASLLGNTARGKSRGIFTKMMRNRRVEISEVHHGCIKTLHFGNQVDGCLSTEFIAERV